MRQFEDRFSQEDIDKLLRRLKRAHRQEQSTSAHPCHKLRRGIEKLKTAKNATSAHGRCFVCYTKTMVRPRRRAFGWCASIVTTHICSWAVDRRGTCVDPNKTRKVAIRIGSRRCSNGISSQGCQTRRDIRSGRYDEFVVLTAGPTL